MFAHAYSYAITNVLWWLDAIYPAK